MNNLDIEPINLRKDFLKNEVPKYLLVLNVILAVTYLVMLTFFFPIGNKLLFALLIAGEVFHVWQVITFIYTVWDTTYLPERDKTFQPPADVFITVAGEPVELVRETVKAAKGMHYPNFEVYILNDGYVAKKDNWREIEVLAKEMGVHCITRTVPGGAKAGNINNALRLSHNPLVAVFDADHVPHYDFLEKTASYFTDSRVGFVQTPQFYKNYDENYLTRGSWEQQELFFGPICKGKNRLNAATMCGTNMLISRQALESVGGMCTESIAEDFVTGLFIHQLGYKSVYHPEVLAEGLATEDLLTYTKQQFRWARGALDILFSYNPMFRRGLTFAQKIQYLSSASFYFSGIVVFLDALLPIIYFFTGLVPVVISSMLLALVFIPYIFLTLYVIQRSSNFTCTFASLGLSMGAFTIHARALFSALLRVRATFSITPKQQQKGNFSSLVTVHLMYISLAVIGIPVAIVREGMSASLLNNAAWVLFTIVVFVPFIASAVPSLFASKESTEASVPKPTYGAVSRI